MGAVIFLSQTPVAQRAVQAVRLMMPSQYCPQLCGGLIYAHGVPHRHSSTGQEDEEFYIQFADGSSASGVLFTEVVTVAGLTIPSLTFGSATEYTG